MSEDDELLARLKKADAALSSHPLKDPIKRLPRGQAVKLSPKDMTTLGLSPPPAEPCRARAHIMEGFNAYPSGIAAAGPVMIFCGRPKGHTGDHYRQPPVKVGLRWLLHRSPLTSEAGGWSYRWASERSTPTT